MLKTMSRVAATPVTRAVGCAAGPAVRNIATEAAGTEVSGAAGSSSKRVMGPLEIPVWVLVGIGAAAAGFFGKMLHDDNIQIRQKLVQLRERSDTRFDRVGEQLDDIKRDVREISVAVVTRPAQK